MTAALLQLSSVSVPLRTLELCIEQLGNYLKKFRNRLASRHRLHLDRLHKLMDGIRTIMLKWKQLELPEVATVQEVIARFDRNLDGVNVLEIETYLKSSKVSGPVGPRGIYWNHSRLQERYHRMRTSRWRVKQILPVVGNRAKVLARHGQGASRRYTSSRVSSLLWQKRTTVRSSANTS